MNDHCGYHFPLHFSPEFHDFHHLKLVPGTSSHSNCSTQHIQITKISQLNRIKTRFLSSKQVSHQLWLVWHLGLDPWHRRQIWQIHHTQVTFFILQWCLRGKPCYAMQFSRPMDFHIFTSVYIPDWGISGWCRARLPASISLMLSKSDLWSGYFSTLI